MTHLNIISVDPAKSSKTDMLERHFSSLRIKGRVLESIENPRDSKLFLNAFLGVNNKVSLWMSSKLMILRLIIGAMLISYGVYALTHSNFDFGLEAMPLPLFIYIATIALGGSIILGFLTRPCSVAAFVIFGAFSILAGIDGYMNLSLIFPAMAGMVFMLTGPGVYSVDQLIRRFLINKARKRKLNKQSNSFSYRAFAEN